MEKADIVVLADGSFPRAPHCLELLKNAPEVICCDGAAEGLIRYGRQPEVIIGDMDSLPLKLKRSLSSKIIQVDDQNSNDLTKAMNYCRQQGYKKATILGATGRREDHSLGNISLLLEYNRFIEAEMITDYGSLFLLESGVEVACRPGETISIFSVDNRVRVSSKGLKYKLDELRLKLWYVASLNECTGNTFTLYFNSDFPLIIFRAS